MKWYLQRPTLIESLAVVAIIAVSLALLLPTTKWASSGNIRFPVRVLVFDAASGAPIENAEVGIFRAPPVVDLTSLEEGPGNYNPSNRIRDADRGVTNAGGAVVINYEFTTGASHVRPAAHAHLRWSWVSIKSEGYGSLVVPVRYESLPTAALRAQKELLVTVGLIAANQ